jgi:sec-independent protein translocase protein TatB
MLDIGFSELMLIGVVALIVIGPERLPRVARTAGHLLGRFQRYVSEVKADINREIELADLKKIQSSVEDAARSIERTVKSEMQEAEETLRSAEADLNEAGAALEKTGAELNQALAMPHMGMLGATAASATDTAAPDRAPLDSEQPASSRELPPGLASATGAAQPAPTPAEADSVPSPQLELGLAALPPADVASEPRQQA